LSLNFVQLTQANPHQRISEQSFRLDITVARLAFAVSAVVDLFESGIDLAEQARKFKITVKRAKLLDPLSTRDQFILYS
jgi:hypothetical protein